MSNADGFGSDLAIMFSEWIESLDCNYAFDSIDKVWVDSGLFRKTTKQLYYYWLANYHTKWIDVKNRLPNESGKYLALDGTDGFVYCIFFKITPTYQSWETEYIQNTDGDIVNITYNSFITHWLPLSVLPQMPVKQFFR